jgi:hypothetical protein
VAGAKKNAARLGQTIVFVDESGLSERPHRCRTWAPRGQTPVLQYHFNWKWLSAMAGVTWWNFYFRLFPGTICSPQVVVFLDHLLRHVPGKVLVIWDRLGTHRSRLVREFVAGFCWSTCRPTRPNSTRWSTSGATGSSTSCRTSVHTTLANSVTTPAGRSPACAGARPWCAPFGSKPSFCDSHYIIRNSIMAFGFGLAVAGYLRVGPKGRHTSHLEVVMAVVEEFATLATFAIRRAIKLAPSTGASYVDIAPRPGGLPCHCLISIAPDTPMATRNLTGPGVPHIAWQSGFEALFATSAHTPEGDEGQMFFHDECFLSTLLRSRSSRRATARHSTRSNSAPSYGQQWPVTGSTRRR